MLLAVSAAAGVARRPATIENNYNYDVIQWAMGLDAEDARNATHVIQYYDEHIDREGGFTRPQKAVLAYVDFRDYDLVLPGCELKWGFLKNVPNATGSVDSDANHKNFKNALNLVPPHNAAMQWRNDDAERAAKIPSASTWVEEASCAHENAHGDVWSTQIIGPFKTLGGLDWWTFFWDDVAYSSKYIAEGRSVVSAFQMQPIDEDGNVIDTELGEEGSLHEHHVLVNYESASSPYHTMSFSSCMLGLDRCMSRETMIATADHRLLNARKSECMDIPKPLTMSLLYNDVRPMDSPPKVWYYAVSFRFSQPGQCGIRHPGDEPDPLSMWTTQGLGYGPTAESAIQAVRLYNEPEAFYWNTMRIPFGGYFFRGGWHVHGLNWQASWLFDQRPEDLFLPEANQMPMPFSETSPRMTAAQLTARLDRAGPLCRSYSSKEVPFGMDGLAECRGRKGEMRHVAKYAQLTNIGIFGGFPANTTKTGYVDQHMGCKYWVIADDGLTHNTAQFAGLEDEQFHHLTSLEDQLRVLSLSLRHRWILRLREAGIEWLLVAIFVGLPAALAYLAACCFARKRRPQVLKVAAAASFMLALAYYWWYHNVLAAPVGNTIDRNLNPAYHDPLLFVYTLVPALFFLGAATISPGSVCNKLRSIADSMGSKLKAEPRAQTMALKMDKEPILKSEVEV